MCEYEVVKTDLSPEEHLHVDLVRVERAEEDILGVEVVAPGDFGVELLHVGEAGDDARGRSLSQLAVEHQARSPILTFLRISLSLSLSHCVVVILFTTETENVRKLILPGFRYKYHLYV